MTREHTPLDRPISRRRLLASIVAVPLIGAVLAACGDDDSTSVDGEPSATSATPAPSTPATDAPAPATSEAPPAPAGLEHPKGATDVVLRVDAGVGGFTTPQFSFGAQPMLLVTGDGTMYTPGAVPEIFPGPMLPAVTIDKIDEASIQKILAAAEKFGLLGAIPDYTKDQPPVTDVGSTIVTINVNGKTYRHEAYALGIPGAPDGAPVSKERENLQSFVTLVGDVRSLVGSDQVTSVGGVEQVQEFAIASMPVDPSQMEQDPKPTLAAWPDDLGVDLDAVSAGKGCKVVPAEKVLSLFKDANQNSFYTQKNVNYSILLRAQLPGSPAC